MKAAYLEKTGPPEVIVYGDLPRPEPSPTQVLVRVKAVAVNPIDTYIRSGAIAMELPMPYLIGCDLAGEVEAVGREVQRLSIGDRVWGSNQGMLGRQGTFAEWAAVEEHWLYRTPEGVNDQSAVAVALVGLTAWLGLFRRAAVQRGEALFVNGGTGGVGSMVVQMAKAVGARVITTAGSDAKVEAARRLGADVAVNYRNDQVDDAIRRFAPEGIDVWWETLREPDFERTVSHLAPRGRMIVMAGRDARPVFPVGPFYVKDGSILGFAMFNALPDEQQKAAEQINRWLASGQLKPRIDRVMPLSEVAEAHRIQQRSTIEKTGELSGKIVLVP